MRYNFASLTIVAAAIIVSVSARALPDPEKELTGYYNPNLNLNDNVDDNPNAIINRRRFLTKGNHISNTIDRRRLVEGGDGGFRYDDGEYDEGEYNFFTDENENEYDEEEDEDDEEDDDEEDDEEEDEDEEDDDNERLPTLFKRKEEHVNDFGVVNGPNGSDDDVEVEVDKDGNETVKLSRRHKVLRRQNFVFPSLQENDQEQNKLDVLDE